MLEVNFAILLVILANEELDWFLFNWDVSLVDLILPKSENLNKKTSLFQFLSDQMTISKHILRHIEVVCQ